MIIKPIAEPCQDWGCIHNSGWDPDRESHCDLLKKPVKKHGSLRLDKHPEFATPDIINRVKRVERTLAQLRRSYLEECEVMLIESQTKLKQAYRIIPELEWFLEGACVRAVCFNEKPPSRNSLAGSLAVCGECEVDGCRVRCAAISLQRILEVETDGEDAQSAMEGVT